MRRPTGQRANGVRNRLGSAGRHLDIDTHGVDNKASALNSGTVVAYPWARREVRGEISGCVDKKQQ